MKLIALIPALNEEASIADVISRIPERIDGISEIEVIVVDDGSVDRTAEIATERGAAVISFEKHRGLGAAVREGLAEAVKRGADVVAQLDADGQHNPADIPLLIGIILAGEADFVTASRFNDPAFLPDMPIRKYWGNLGMARIVSALCGRRFYDVSCGFRAYSREAALSLDLKGDFTCTHESILFFSDRGFRIAEVPIVVRGVREFGKSRNVKSLWVYAFNALGIIFRYLRENRLSGK